MKTLYVEIADPSPMIHMGLNPTSRMVVFTLTDYQVQLLKLKHKEEIIVKATIQDD